MNDIFRDLIAEGIMVVYQDGRGAREGYQTGATGPTRTQTFPPPGEMRVLQGADRVLGTSHLRKQSFHGSGQGCRSLRVAYSGKQDGRPGFPGLRQLLLKVYPGFLCQSSIPLQLNTLRTSLDVEWKGIDGL